MNLAIIGYGKMGKTIEKIALDRGHKIVAKIDKLQNNDISILTEKGAEAAIEFTEPSSAFENLKYCIENKIPVVSGTTGWLDKYDALSEICQQEKGAFFYASNFSVGVNLFFKLNKLLAELMAQHNYTAKIEETHHTQKKDAPSGTAITLAQGILQRNKQYEKWALKDKGDENSLPIEAFRVNDVPGTHEITYHSEIDDISIKHTAHSREGFALGAVIAAEWLLGKTGVFGMQDMLKL